MQASALHAGSGQLSLAALAVFAIAPLSAGSADGGAPAVLALDMRADARAPQSLQIAPLAVMRLIWCSAR